jgi:hypothetical protein
MADNEKILVEVDYDNIVLIDPNKVIDENGKGQERLVKQEDLVMYANLEAVFVPRTKFNIGAPQDDTVNPVTIATNNFSNINFLNPGGGGAFTTEWSDEITGKDALKGGGVNQLSQVIDNNSNFYVKQKVNNVRDTQTLGITNIVVDNNASQTPVVSIDLVDVGGRTLFEKGDESPYAVFFNLPYPTFYLTLKGYFGKAIRYQLILAKFTSELNAQDGNFTIKLTFFSYKYTILADLQVGSILALPNMYNTNYTLTPTTETNQNVEAARISASLANSDGQIEKKSTNVVVGKGYQKIKELYSEYKSKDLIPDDFPELSLPQLIVKLENFERNIVAQLGTENFEPFTDIKNYKEAVNLLQKNVFSTNVEAWSRKYLDLTNFYLLKKDPETSGPDVRVYKYKKEIQQVLQKIENSKTELNKFIEEFKLSWEKNKTLGPTGSYTIGGKKTESAISFNITYDLISKSYNDSDIDWCETYKRRFGRELNEVDCKKEVIKNYGIVSNVQVLDENNIDITETNLFVFNGDNSFNKEINQMITKANNIEQQIEKELTDILQKKLESAEGLGFKPTIRNIFAILFASIEGMFRLLDDVHKQAFDQRFNKVRYNALFSDGNDTVSVESKDNIQKTFDPNQTNGDIQVYPWPEFFVKSETEKNTKFDLRYPGESDLIEKTQADNYDIWPEVEFVEEMIKGLTQRDVVFNASDVASDEEYNVSRLTLNAIEFPTTNRSYGPKEFVKFFYEIKERLIIASTIDKLNRDYNQTNDITEVIAQMEAYNILTSLSFDNPQIITALKNFKIDNSQNFELFLRQISNQGIGESWQLYIRGLYNTPYLKELTEQNKDFAVLPNSTVLGPSPNAEVESINKLTTFLEQNSNIIDFTDIYPIVNLEWAKTNLANGAGLASIANVISTSSVIKFNTDKKHITNFLNNDNETTKRPLINFGFLNIIVPSSYNNSIALKEFYESRYNDSSLLLPTEGLITYDNSPPSSIGNNQTTSIFNSPFMINALQNATQKLRNNDPYPFIEAAYLFLNSLPLATLKEKYISKNETSFDELDYLISSFKKFGATHKLPYAWVLKYGAIWNRYKSYVDSNGSNDFLSSVWTDADTFSNFDPIGNNPTRQYNLTISGTTYPIVLQNVGNNVTSMNLGFYPRLINDFYFLLTNKEYFQTYSDSEIQEKINNQSLFLGRQSENYSQGVDPSDSSRSISMRYWYSLIKTKDSSDFSTENNQKTIVLPSFGSINNQVNFQCFTDSNTLKEEVLNNQSVFNGSARIFWASPNYGYFDASQAVKPQYNEYFKEILTQSQQQTSFSINSSYSKIDELLPTFKKDILDKFEEEFLKFTKSSLNIPEENRGPESYLKNFQLLLSNMLIIDDVNTSSSNVVGDVWSKQTTQISQLIRSFLLNNDVYFRYGNPSNFNRRIFNSFSTKTVVDPYEYNGYSINSLPPQTTLLSSEINNPDAWAAMKKYVGIYTIPGMNYSDSGSTLTDFFIDIDVEFNAENVKNLFPLIQIYGTQKLQGPIDKAQFKQKLYDYLINNVDGFENNILQKLITIVQKQLPDVSTVPQENRIPPSNDAQSKIEMWQSFKTFNDRWIAGNDYKNKTLFEDVLFLDRASRDLGQLVYIDIFKLKDRIKARYDGKGRVIDLISAILEENKFVMMPLPAFVNFYGATTPQLTETTTIESSFDFANDLFGTFLNVDYRNSSPKLVCFYTDVPSQHLDLKNNPNYLYRTDAFDLRRPSNNPNRESLVNKKDWYFSNRCVGFNVDFGTRNQSMFKTLILGQENTSNTSESFKINEMMADQAGGRSVSQQNVSLFQVYRNRSYTCTVMGMGNALIQPTMYFNLRHVPMFSGPYMILSVKHILNSGDFTTQFTGVRMPVFSLPTQNNSLASLNVNLFSKIFGDLKADIQKAQASGELSNNEINNKNSIQIQTAKDRTFISEGCIITGQTIYSDYKPAPQAIRSTYSIQEIISTIKSIVTGTDDNAKKVRAMVFSTIYVDGGDRQEVLSWNNNFGGAPLKDLQDNIISYSESANVYFQKQYLCLRGTNGYTLPYPTFENVNNNISFLRDKFRNLTGNIDLTSYTADTISANTLTNSLFKNWVEYWPKNNEIDFENFVTTNPQKANTLKTKFNESVSLINSNNLFT